jgi:hypothetical protein
VEERTGPSPRLVVAGAIALAVLAIMAFSLLSHSSVAGAAGVSATPGANQNEPIQSGSATPAPQPRDGHNCPHHGGQAGGSAPSNSDTSSGTQL